MTELISPRLFDVTSDVVRRLERFTIGALPARSSWELPGWVCLSSDGGHVARVNSAAPTPRPPERPRGDGAGAPDNGAGLDGEAASVEEVAASYRGRGLRPLIRWTPLAPAGTYRQLVAAGWSSGGEVLVMTRRLESLERSEGAKLAEPAGDRRVELAGLASDAWRSAYTSAYGAEEAAERLRLALSAPDAKRFAELKVEGETLGVGLGVCHGGTLGVFDMFTKPVARRHGVASDVVKSLLAWGAREGAELAFLQVAASNDPAIQLYRSLGFEPAYSYVYAAPVAD